MNSVVRTAAGAKDGCGHGRYGRLYEGICGYYKGPIFLTRKKKPISMNPFKVTKEEYDLNFGGKKNFLKSLIFLIIQKAMSFRED